MMASFMSYFGAGRKDPHNTTRDAIVGLRQQQLLMEKKEEYLNKKIEEDLKKAKANAVSNKAVATAALKRKKLNELELERLNNSRHQLEIQISTLESANLNAETMAAMKKGADALKVIHSKVSIGKVDATMSEVNEQMEHANEIAEALANPLTGPAMDEDELIAELSQLQEDVLNERLAEVDHAPVHLPRVDDKSRTAAVPLAQEEDEDAQLKELQAALAM